MRRRDVDSLIFESLMPAPHWFYIIGLTDLPNSGTPDNDTSASEMIFVWLPA